MTLDPQSPPVSIDEAIEFGRQDAISTLEALAEEESRKGGDGRAIRIVRRLAQMAGYRLTP